MTCFIALLIILVTPVDAIAGEPGTLLTLLKDYADHTQRLQAVRAARQDGSSYPSELMIDLKKDLLAAIKAVDAYRTQLLRSKEEAAVHEVPIALKYAYLAMFHIISLELDHHLYRSNLALMLSEKYAEIWRSIDPSVPKPAPAS